MANKLFLVSATLAFFFLLTNASIYRTIVEVDEEDATNQASPFRIPRCRKEFQQAQHLRACQQWIHQQARQSGGGPGWVLEGEFDFEDDMENPQGQGQGQQQRPPLLQECCNELYQEETQCVCPSLKVASKAVRQQVQQQGGQQGQQGQQQQVSRIYQVARHLPNVCNIRHVSVCPFQKTMPGPYY